MEVWEAHSEEQSELLQQHDEDPNRHKTTLYNPSGGYSGGGSVWICPDCTPFANCRM